MYNVYSDGTLDELYGYVYQASQLAPWMAVADVGGEEIGKFKTKREAARWLLEHYPPMVRDDWGITSGKR